MGGFFVQVDDWDFPLPFKSPFGQITETNRLVAETDTLNLVSIREFVEDDWVSFVENVTNYKVRIPRPQTDPTFTTCEFDADYRGKKIHVSGFVRNFANSLQQNMTITFYS